MVFYLSLLLYNIDKRWVIGLGAFLYFVILGFSATAQASSSPQQDTKVINIVNADRLHLNTIDSLHTEIQTLAGHVQLRQGGVQLNCDTAVINPNSHITQAFGHVHIIDNDTVHMFSDSAVYNSDTKLAVLTDNVYYSDGKNILTTPKLFYYTKEKMSIYNNGGRLLNKANVLTSDRGYYYGTIKTAFFKGDVVMINAENTIYTDSLKYSTNEDKVFFVEPTQIVSTSTWIHTIGGFYNTKTQIGTFTKRPIIVDGKKTLIVADSIFFNNDNGHGHAFNNVIFSDTVQGVTVFSNDMVSERTTKQIMATQNPLLVLIRSNDTILIKADTLFSARVTDLDNYKSAQLIVPKEVDSLFLSPIKGRSRDSTAIDSMSKVTKVKFKNIKDSTDPSLSTEKLYQDSLSMYTNSPLSSNTKDTISALLFQQKELKHIEREKHDTLLLHRQGDLQHAFKDSISMPSKEDTVLQKSNIIMPFSSMPKKSDTIAMPIKKDSLLVNKQDTIGKKDMLLQKTNEVGSSDSTQKDMSSHALTRAEKRALRRQARKEKHHKKQIATQTVDHVSLSVADTSCVLSNVKRDSFLLATKDTAHVRKAVPPIHRLTLEEKRELSKMKRQQILDSIHIEAHKDSLAENEDTTGNQEIDTTFSVVKKGHGTIKAKIKRKGKGKQKGKVEQSKSAVIIHRYPMDSANNRYFLMYRHVRIFQDSLQSICDSLFYALSDSTFRLYYKPITWSQDNQLTGDSMFVYTHKHTPQLIYIPTKAFSISQVVDSFFNQLKGKSMFMFFDTSGHALDSIWTDGSPSKLIYYGQDDKTKKLIAGNVSSSDKVNLYFHHKELDQVLFIKSITGKAYPMWKMPYDEMFLQGFKWQIEKRPHIKATLIEDRDIKGVNRYFPSDYPNKLNINDFNVVGSPVQDSSFVPFFSTTKAHK